MIVTVGDGVVVVVVVVVVVEAGVVVVLFGGVGVVVVLFGGAGVVVVVVVELSVAGGVTGGAIVLASELGTTAEVAVGCSVVA